MAGQKAMVCGSMMAKKIITNNIISKQQLQSHEGLLYGIIPLQLSF